MINQFHFAVALDNQWEQLCDECIRQIKPLSANNHFGFLYTTDLLAQDIPAIINKLREDTGIHDWVGTVGIGIVAGDSEIYDTPAMTLLVADVDSHHYRMFSTVESGLNEFSSQQQSWLTQASPLFGVVHGDPRLSETVDILKELNTLLPDSFFVGGLSSSQTNSFPQVAGIPRHSPLSGVMFDKAISVRTSLTQGCTPIGDKHVITGCKRNFIYTINDEPALEVFKQDIGDVLSRDLQKVAGYIFVGLPIPNAQDSNQPGEYKIRNLMGIDTQSNTMIIGEEVSEGQTIQFCKRDNQSAWQDHIDTLQKLKQQIDAPIKGALYFSCLGRGRALFGDSSQELKMIQEQLGEFPMVGFFANGEFARHELYGYTGVLTVFV